MTLTQIRFETRNQVLVNVYTDQLAGNVIRAYADVRYHSSCIWILSENPLKTAEHISRVLGMPFVTAGSDSEAHIDFFSVSVAGGLDIYLARPNCHDYFLAGGNDNA